MGPRHTDEQEERQRRGSHGDTTHTTLQSGDKEHETETDPTEFEEPELYESMRRVTQQKTLDEGLTRKRKGNTHQDEYTAKRPGLNLEKMLKVRF